MDNLNAAKKTASEIIDSLKPKFLGGYRSEKWTTEMAEDLAKKLHQSRMDDAQMVASNIKKQFTGHIPMPASNFANRLKFLFTGKF